MLNTIVTQVCTSVTQVFTSVTHYYYYNYLLSQCKYEIRYFTTVRRYITNKADPFHYSP